MHYYTFEGRFSKYNLLDDQKNESLLTLYFPKWFKRDAKFEWNQHFYTISPKNFTGMKMLVSCDNREVGELEQEWKNQFTFRLEDNTGMTKYFTIKKEGAFKREYLLADYQLQPILTVKPVWNWQKWQFNYKFEVYPLEETEARELDPVPIVCYSLIAARQFIRSKSQG
ncbi:MAG TPA: hypothetical protein PKA12_15270 [Saprospiraceae bacterium]|nr:hypothetical protein [Saprospiraceae bacterium]